MRQVAEHRGEVERAGKAEPEAQPAVGHQSVGRTPPGAELARGGTEDVGDGPVELAEAAEARGERDLRDGEIGVIEQPPGEVRPARARELGGSDPDLIVKEPAQVANREPEASRHGDLGVASQSAVDDEADPAADHLGCHAADGGTVARYGRHRRHARNPAASAAAARS